MYLLPFNSCFYSFLSIKLLLCCYLSSAREASQYFFMKIEICDICMRQKSVNQYVRQVYKNEKECACPIKIFIAKQFHLFRKSHIIGRAKRAPHWDVQSRFRVIYICMSVCQYVCCMLRRRNPVDQKRTCSKSSFRLLIIHFDYMLEQLLHGLKRNVHLEMRT